MVNWSDPAVIQKCAAVFANIVHITAGAYALDVLFTSVYDWDIITGKLRWKWTMPVRFLRIASPAVDTHFHAFSSTSSANGLCCSPSLRCFLS